MHVSRFGTRQYHASNDRGATLDIGMGPGQWTPGELLKLALLGCNTLSADQRLATVLGDDFAMTAGIDGEFNEAEDRYTGFTVELVPEAAGLDPAEAENMVRRVQAAIDRQCTIGHTLSFAVPHQTIISVEE